MENLYPLPRQQNDRICTSRNWSAGCPWKLAAHRIDVLRTYVDPKMVQILTKIFKTLLKKAIFIKVLSPYSTENCVCVFFIFFILFI